MKPLALALIGAILPDDALARYPWASTPGNRFQHGVLNALLAAGIDTTVITLRPVASYPRTRQLFFRSAKGVLKDKADYQQIGFINAGALKTATAGITSFSAICRWARHHRRGQRVILFYNAYNPSAWVGILAARLTRSKLVAIVADLRVPGSGGGKSFLRRLEYKLAVASLRRVDALVCVTRQIAADYAANAPVLLLNGGVPDDMIPPLSKRSDNVPNSKDKFVIMYAGSLTELAGVPLLLRSFERLSDPGFSLWITGAGELEHVVRLAATNDPRIQYLGRLSRQDLLATYTAADVLINPHSTQLLTGRYVFPSKLLEYLASGRPVITTATPEIATEFGDLCTVIDRDDPQALTDAIKQVAITPKAERLSRAASVRARVTDERAWSRQGQRLVQFLVDLTSV